MKYGVIATWKMAFDGISQNYSSLKNGAPIGNVLENIINVAEDYPGYTSVGYGGLPNRVGEVELDAGYMEGDTLQFGAIAGAKNIAHPVSVARKLSSNIFNNLLVGAGAEQYAKSNGFAKKEMLTQHSKNIWINRKEEMKTRKLEAYDGHDTIGVVGIDCNGSMASATSTSGLFMKEPGRVGDSPLCGCGFYANSSFGAATATGLGEDIAKGVLSYEVVRLIKEGFDAQKACDKALSNFQDDIPEGCKLDAISLIAIGKNGSWGVATNVDFSFVVATSNLEPTVFIATPQKNNTTNYYQPSASWIAEYDKKHQF